MRLNMTDGGIVLLVGTLTLIVPEADVMALGVRPMPPGEGKFERWLGRDALTVLQAAERVQAFAVRPWPKDHPDPGQTVNAPQMSLPANTPEQVQGFAVYATAPVHDGNLVRQIVDKLLDESSYAPRSPPFSHKLIKGCVFRPGVALRFWAGTRSLDVIFCFSCDQIRFGETGKSRRTKAIEIGDIDPARPEFVRLVKEVLPGVPAIAAIPERRTRATSDNQGRR